MNEQEFKQKFTGVLETCSLTTLHPLDEKAIHKFLRTNLNSYRDFDLMHEVLRERYPALGTIGEGRDWFSGMADSILIEKEIMP